MTLGRRVLLTALVSAAPAGAALGHHGWSGYSETPERMSGVIKSVTYSNPHVSIELEAQGRTWHVVLAPPSRMQTRGLPAGALAPGQTVTIEAYRHLQNAGELRAEWIALGDKRTELR